MSLISIRSKYVAITLITIIFIPLIIAGSTRSIQSNPLSASGEWGNQVIQYRPGEAIIELIAGMSVSALESAFTVHSLTQKYTIEPGRSICVNLTNTKNTLEQINSLAQSGLFESVSPNEVGQVSSEYPNERMVGEFDLQWYLENIGQPPTSGSDDADIDAPEGWEHGYGHGYTTLIILDSGLPVTNGELSHPELDDTQRFLLGVDYIGDAEPFRDIHGHGTYMTGIATAETDNATGIAGVNWWSYVIMYKVVEVDGGVDYGDVAAAIQHAITNNDRTPFCVINASFRITLDWPILRQAIVAAGEADMLLVAATGNDFQDEWVGYPARYSIEYDNVIAVAATDRNDFKSPYSNAGPQVTVSAPGGNVAEHTTHGIYSTAPGYQVTMFGANQYGYAHGTSASTSITSGLATLIRAMSADLSPLEIKNLIIQNADKIHPETYTYDENGHNEDVGFGRINIYSTLINVPVSGLRAWVNPLEGEPLGRKGGGIQPMGGNYNYQVDLYWAPHGGRKRSYYRLDWRENPSHEWNHRGYFTSNTYTDWVVKDGHTYYYRIYPTDVNMDEIYQPSEIVEVHIPRGGPPERVTIEDRTLITESVPNTLTLESNYPNPFNPSTQIKFGLSATSRVRLQILNIRGQIVRLLVDDVKTAGWHTVTWDGKNESGREVASGIYLYLIEADNKKILKKLTLIR